MVYFDMKRYALMQSDCKATIFLENNKFFRKNSLIINNDFLYPPAAVFDEVETFREVGGAYCIITGNRVRNLNC
jgi:hypothetical protein